MSTLSSTFKLYDGYTNTIDKITAKSEKATNKILAASGATDKFNNKLNATGASANKASGGLGKLIGIATLAVSALKGINITDAYTNTAARLDLINDGLQTQQELQDKIFASANRSKGSYTDMAGAISKMGLTRGDAFGSNDELIGFTELLQKSFKVGGASGSEQSSGIQQLTQAMAAGKLQGDEFRSIMENAPMVAQAIADYTGKTKGELKQMSTDGLITADIIKNSMFAASQDINKQFEKMPYTFADIWTKIKNGGLKAFDGVMEKINDLINTPGFEDFINKMISGFDSVAIAASGAIDGAVNLYKFISSNWSTIGPIIEGVAAAWIAYQVATGIATTAQWLLNAAMVANPVGIIIIVLAVLIGIVVVLWEKCAGFREFVVGMWVNGIMMAAWGYNQLVVIYNALGTMLNNMITQMQNFGNFLRAVFVVIIQMSSAMAAAVVHSFSFITTAINTMIISYNAIADMFGQKTIDIKFSSDSLTGIIGRSSQIAVAGVNAAYTSSSDLADKARMGTMDPLDRTKFTSIIDNFGKTIEGFTVSGWLSGKFDEAIAAYGDASGSGNSTDPTKVVGTGSKGAVAVDMSSEDLQYLRDASERKYTNKFSTSTLAPNISTKFGNVTKEADADKIAGRIKKILQEEIAMSAEGAY